jgi:hypothetical protein
MIASKNLHILPFWGRFMYCKFTVNVQQKNLTGLTGCIKLSRLRLRTKSLIVKGSAFFWRKSGRYPFFQPGDRKY